MLYLCRITGVVLAVVAVTQAASVAPDGANNRQDKGLDKLLPSLLSLINITIANDPCDTESKDPPQGVCYSQKQCEKERGGKQDGYCANGYGVCCVGGDDGGDNGSTNPDVTITES